MSFVRISGQWLVCGACGYVMECGRMRKERSWVAIGCRTQGCSECDKLFKYFIPIVTNLEPVSPDEVNSPYA